MINQEAAAKFHDKRVILVQGERAGVQYIGTIEIASARRAGDCHFQVQGIEGQA
jgi:hypothetical protein